MDILDDGVRVTIWVQALPVLNENQNALELKASGCGTLRHVHVEGIKIGCMSEVTHDENGVTARSQSSPATPEHISKLA